LSERWKRVGQLFEQALAAPPDERDAVLGTSSDPADVKAEVRALVAAHERAGDFLEHPPSADLPTGTTIGPYRIIALIGRGGMGVVYEAEDTRLHRRVALKCLAAEYSTHEQQRQRLRQEARAAAALQHSGIATVYALEEFAGQLFISSEFVDGETLRAELERGPVPIDRVLKSGVEITRAMRVAHERGIVHRDLKPENIMRTTSGGLKILDFGLAQFGEAAQDLMSRPRLTRQGGIAGTPPYMAPEQLLGRETDFRVDHFAFGILLYELSTARHPFGGNSLPSTIARILAAPPETAPAHAGVPPDLGTIIDRCLEKNPAHRFASTRELLSALELAAGTSVTPLSRAAPAEAIPPVAAAAPVAAALTWWRFHQFAAALAYWAMVWPSWHVHRSLGRVGLFFFFATVAAVVVAGNLRLHLWFSSRVYPDDLAAQRADVATWIRWADVAFAALLVIGGMALPADHAAWAAMFISFGIGSALAFLFIEPATARAAFRR